MSCTNSLRSTVCSAASAAASTAACALTLTLAAAPAAWAAQFGMVVGIDDYRAFQPFPAPPGELSDLQGAVNDANRIAGAMRSVNIDLPESRFLTDSNATVENFLKSWRAMMAGATPGDTLIVTFSGHGGQEHEVSEPFDEVTDQKDETIMFFEFDPENPRRGRLNDDQLREVLNEAAAFNVIWVMDSCHSAGLTRKVKPGAIGLTRNGGVWDAGIVPLEDEIIAEVGDDGSEGLPHVTQILATASEERLVTETRIDGKQHGALSWFFAEAITGAADTNKDGAMTRAEIAEFLEDRVFAHMNQSQQPRILPRGDSRTVLSFNDPPPPPPPTVPKREDPPPGTVTVKFEGTPPPGLTQGSFFAVDVSPELLFEDLGGGRWDVYNHTGDRITTIAGEDAWRLVARTKALRHIRGSKKANIPGIGLTAGQDHTLNPVGAIVSYKFAPPSPDMGYITLFNVASNGTLQYLHPLNPSGDDPVGQGGFPVRFRVTEPTGADQLVAIFCTRPPLDLRRMLAQFDGKTVPDDDTLPSVLNRGTCQTGIIGLYTEGG
ncbi:MULTISPECIES: caspase family protein [unclassified Marinovum]